MNQATMGPGIWVRHLSSSRGTATGTAAPRWRPSQSRLAAGAAPLVPPDAPWLVALFVSVLIVPFLHGDTVGWRDAQFGLFSILLFAYAAIKRPRRGAWRGRAEPWFYLFLALCIAHSAFVVLGHLPLGDYIRGVVPFLCLLYLYVFSRLITTGNARVCYWIVILVGLAYALESLYYLPRILGGEVYRVSAVNKNSALPFPFIGIHLSIAWLLDPAATLRRRLMLLAIAVLCLAAVLETGTKSTILATVCPLLVMPLALKQKRIRYIAISSVAVPAVLAAAFYIVPSDVALRALRITLDEAGGLRITDPVSYTSRMEETAIAIRLYEEAPLFGQGLGYRFDATGTYHSAAGESSIPYIHNSPLYLLMDFGPLGCLYLIGLARPIYTTVRGLRRAFSYDRLGIAMALSGCAIHLLFFCMVRIIQFNVIVTMLIAMAALPGIRIASSARRPIGGYPLPGRAVYAPAPSARLG